METWVRLRPLANGGAVPCLPGPMGCRWSVTQPQLVKRVQIRTGEGIVSLQSAACRSQKTLSLLSKTNKTFYTASKTRNWEVAILSRDLSGRIGEEEREPDHSTTRIHPVQPRLIPQATHTHTRTFPILDSNMPLNWKRSVRKVVVTRVLFSGRTVKGGKVVFFSFPPRTDITGPSV